MNKELKDTLSMTALLILLAIAGIVIIFLMQSTMHPYETNCHTEAIGRVCDVNYHLYWKPTLSI